MFIKQKIIKMSYYVLLNYIFFQIPLHRLQTNRYHNHRQNHFILYFDHFSNHFIIQSELLIVIFIPIIVHFKLFTLIFHQKFSEKLFYSILFLENLFLKKS